MRLGSRGEIAIFARDWVGLWVWQWLFCAVGVGLVAGLLVWLSLEDVKAASQAVRNPNHLGVLW